MAQVLISVWPMSLLPVVSVEIVIFASLGEQRRQGHFFSSFLNTLYSAGFCFLTLLWVSDVLLGYIPLELLILIPVVPTFAPIPFMMYLLFRDMDHYKHQFISSAQHPSGPAPTND